VDNIKVVPIEIVYQSNMSYVTSSVMRSPLVRNSPATNPDSNFWDLRLYPNIGRKTIFPQKSGKFNFYFSLQPQEGFIKFRNYYFSFVFSLEVDGVLRGPCIGFIQDLFLGETVGEFYWVKIEEAVNGTAG